MVSHRPGERRQGGVPNTQSGQTLVCLETESLVTQRHTTQTRKRCLERWAVKTHLAIAEDLRSHLDTRKHSILNRTDMPYNEMSYDT